MLKKTPFYEIKDKVKCYFSKQLVSDLAQQKITFGLFQCQLLKEKIIIKKFLEGLPSVEINLAKLSVFQYTKQNTIILKFAKNIDQEKNVQSLLMKFDNQESLRTWEVSIYINYQIILALGKQQLFKSFAYPSQEIIKKGLQFIAKQPDSPPKIGKKISSEAEIKEGKQKVQEIIKKMTKVGYDLTKYSKDGFNPHKKRVYVSEDLQNLCWEEKSGEDLKMVAFKNIKQLTCQKIGHGVLKHVSNPKKQQHCIIYYVTNDKKQKTGSTSQQISQFVDSLIAIMQHLSNQKQ